MVPEMGPALWYRFFLILMHGLGTVSFIVVSSSHTSSSPFSLVEDAYP
jgi:hypothetical protein